MLKKASSRQPDEVANAADWIWTPHQRVDADRVSSSSLAARTSLRLATLHR
jgi:hypothetical protein